MLGFAPIGSQPLGSAPSGTAATSTVTMVSVTPGTATGSQQFTATVVGTNSPSQSVTWTTNAGSINSTGYFTAPAQTASVQTITITATSTQDGTKSGTATATIAAIGSDTTAPVFTGSLVQTAVTSTSCTIDWSSTTHTDNVGITGYEYNINSGIYYAIGNVLAYVFTGFAAATSYTIGVRAFDAAGNRSAVLSITTTTSAAAPTATRTLTIPLVGSGGTASANLSGLTWAFFDQSIPGALLAPVAKGTNATTNASGTLNLSVTSSTLSVGGVGYLIVSDTNGTTAFAAKAFSGPVQVS